jgi:outer membrane protein assembly factor BamE
VCEKRTTVGWPGIGYMRILIILVAAVVIAACKQSPELPAAISPYKIDIQQGNVVTQEMVAKLKAGLTRSQVRFVLGSPLVTDMFHADRWDYIYLMQRQGKPDERRRLTVIFDGDKLLRLEGDVVMTDKSQEPEVPILKPAASVAPVPKPVVAAPSPAPKAEAAKPAEKPAVVAKPAPKPETPVVAPAAVSKPEPVASDSVTTSPAQSVKPDAKAETAAPASKADASKTDAAKADAAKADAGKADTASVDEKKDAPKRGLFGRMLDRIGF